METGSRANRHSIACIAIALVIVTSAFLAAMGNVKADHGAPDAFGYVWVDSNAPAPSIAFSWIEINGTGTDSGVTGGDNWTGFHSIGFNFSFYGQVFDKLCLNSKGYIPLSYGTNDWTNDPIPSASTPNNIIAAYWDDLGVYTSYGAHVYYQTIGAAPDRQFVAEWSQISAYGDPTGPKMTFEIILDESGTITFQYLAMNGFTGTGATVGIEDATGGVGCQYSYNSASISDGLAIRFSQQASFDPPHSDYGVDTNANSLYDWLNVDVVVDVLMAGWYDVEGDLYDGFGSWIARAWSEANLSSGTQTVTLQFDGPSIYANGVNGPYTVNLYLYDASSSWPSYILIELDTHVTGAYLYTDFEQLAAARFAPPHSDYGNDTNANGLYNWLSVDVVVDVATAGWYEIDGYICDASWSWIGDDWTYTYLNAGFQTVTLQFSGIDIYNHGYSGAFDVYLDLFDDLGNWICSGMHVTGAYFYTDFEHTLFSPPHSDYGVDTNANGLYDWLNVDVVVDVTTAGWYDIGGDLWLPAMASWVDSDSSYTYLNTGFQTVTLQFSGMNIYNEGYIGAFDVFLNLYDDFSNWLDGNTHTTGWYNYTAFEHPGALFSPPHSDYGVDTNANSLYDWLNVDVVVSVATAGWYSINGDLWTGNGSWVDFDSSYTYLNAGFQTVTLQFSGIDIYIEGYSGSFDVYLDLYDDFSNWLDSDTHTTAAYLYTDFEHSADDAYEVDDIYTQASTITPGSPQTHSINDGGMDVDWVTFTLSGISDVVIETNGVSGDTRMWLYDSSGVPTTSIRYDDDGGNGTFSRISVSSLPADTYYVKVDEYFNDDEISSYTITLTVNLPTPPDATFSPPHSDYGVDTNANSLYDWLNVDVVVSVATAGWYHISSSLLDGFGGFIDSDSSYSYLNAGIHTVTLQFSGIDINNYGYSGAFDVYLWLYDDSWNLLDTDTHTTGPYNFTDFEQQSHFQLPHSDYGVDTSGSALFEYLVVDTTVDIKAAGNYTVLGVLWDMGNMSTPIAVVINTTYLGVGTHLVQLWFTAGSIISYGVDGPYGLMTELMDDMSSVLDMNMTLTNPYTLSQFQIPPAMLEPPHSDYGEDTNANGLYDYLVVNVTVNVTTAGWYTVSGDLNDMMLSFIDTASNYTYLTAGVHTVQLRFDGTLISTNGLGGPYIVLLSLDDNSGNMISSGFYITNSYMATQFERIGMFVLPHSDYGVDTSGSAAFEYLVVDTTVDIKVAGTYTVIGALYLTNMTPFAVVINTTYLGVGTHLVQLWFPAGSIISCGVDGPYNLETILMDDLSHFLDMNTTLTNPYTIGQFQVPPAMLEPPYTDYGEDTNANVLFDYLVVDVTVNVTTAGWYTVSGDLSDMMLNSIDTASNYTYLAAGVHTVQLRFDGTLISANGVNGPYYVFLSLDDNSGNMISSGFYITNPYAATQFESGAGDITPPTTTIGLAGTPGSNGWYVSSVTVTLTRTDNVGGSGVNYTKYRIDGGSWLTYSAPFSISADGAHTVEFYSVDLAGNTEGTKSSPVKIDKIAPTGSVSVNSGAVYTNSGSVTLALTANDATSGINQVRYSNDSVTWSAWEAFSSPKAWTLSAGDGAKTVYCQVRDAAGTVSSTFTDGIVLDTTAPVTNYVADGYDLTLSPLDAGSGVNHTKYRIDGGAWQTYAGTITPGASGSYLVEFNSTDNAGNTEGIKSVTLPLTADTIPPVTTASTAGTSPVTVTLTATDIGTGVNYTKYRIDGGSWLTYSAPIVLSTVGSHTVEFNSTDLAGNTEATKNVTVQITETVPPVTAASKSGTSGLSGWYKSNVTVTLTATDAGTGVNYTKYRIDGGAWLTYTVPIVMSTVGSHAVEFYSVDLAGNTEATKNVTVKIDNTAPASTASKSGSAVTISSSDATSGVNTTLYRIDGGAWLTYAGVFNVTATGNHTIEYYSTDEAGNAEGVKTIYVDNGGGGAGISTGDLTPMLLLLGLIAAAIAISLFFLIGKRKKKRDGAQPPQQPQVVARSVKASPPPPPPEIEEL